MGIKNKFYIYSLYVALILYTAYTYLWSTFSFGVTTVVQYVLLGLTLVGCCFYVVSPHRNKNTFVSCLVVLWLIIAFGYWWNGSSATTQFKDATYILLIAAPFVAMNYNFRHTEYVFLIMSVISIWMFFVTMSIMLVENENSYGGGYLSLVALPVVLYFVRNQGLRNQVICCCIILALVLMSAKRGDILACVLALVVYFFVLQTNSKQKAKFSMAIIFGVVVVAFIGYFVYDYLMENSPVFAYKIEQTAEGDSSGRDRIYTQLWEYFLSAPLETQLFGGGFDATIKIADIHAHSDWLEVLSSNGLFGVSLYLLAFVSLFREMKKCKHVPSKAVIAVILAIWLVKGIFSMFIYSAPTVLLFALVGYLLNPNLILKNKTEQ